jgi:hypothetical protein
MKCKCGELVIKGQQCSLGNTHDPFWTPRKISIAIIIVAVISVIVYYSLKEEAKRKTLLVEWARRGKLAGEWAKDYTLSQDELDWSNMLWS